MRSLESIIKVSTMTGSTGTETSRFVLRTSLNYDVIRPIFEDVDNVFHLAESRLQPAHR